MVPELSFSFIKRLFLLFISWGVIVFFSSSCTIKTAVSPSPALHFDRSSFENLLGELTPGITAVKGYGELLLKGTEEREVKINLILKKPGKARIEVLNFLYQPSMLILSDGKEVSIIQDDDVRTVPVKHFNFQKLTGEELSLNDFVSIMLGCPPGWRSLKEQPFKMEPRQDNVMYRFDASKNKTIRLTVSGKDKLLKRYAVFNPDRKVPEMSVSWMDYRSSGSGLRFPHDIRIDWPLKGVGIHLTYEKVEIDPGITEQNFSL